MTLLVVETQRACYLFACPSAAESFATAERQWWDEHCPGGWGTINPVRMGLHHRFRPNLSGWGSIDPQPMLPGPGQDRCHRVRRHVRRWDRERAAWLDQAGV